MGVLFFHSSFVGETIRHDPDELLASYRQQQQDLEGLHGQLQTILGEALTNRSGR